MSRSYHTEDKKLVKISFPKWTWDEGYIISEILYNKGYFTNCVTRIGADGKAHDAIQVEREDVPVLVEQLFRQRLVAEYQAEGHGKAAIIFSHDYSSETIIRAVERFQKNKKE